MVNKRLLAKVFDPVMFPFLRPTHPLRHSIGGQFGWWMSLALMGLGLAGCTKTLKVVHGGPALPGEEVDVSPCDPGKYGGTFVMVDIVEPKTFNPEVPGDLYSQAAQGYLLDSLVHSDPMNGNNPIPGLAKSWDIGADKKTYTFHLRHGLRWSDGVPFNADDVMFTLDCMLTEITNPTTGEKELKYPNRGADDFTFGGKRMTYRKIDDYTVELYTPEIFSTFLVQATEITVLPKHKLLSAFNDGTFLSAWSSKTAIDHPEEIVGMGAYTLYKFQPGERIVYAPNPYYWRVDSKGQRLPYTDFFVDRFVASMDADLLMFATGKSDISGSYPTIIPATEVPWISRNSKLYDFTVFNCGANPGSYFYWFNLKTGLNKEGKPFIEPYKSAWFNNQLFRQAIMYGFDREGICKGVYFGRAEPEQSVINQGNPAWYNPNVKHYNYDPAKAWELFKQAGFHWDEHGTLQDAQGHPVEFELNYSDRLQQYSDMAAVFKNSMKDLGIDVKVTPLDFGALLKKVDSTYDYEMCMIGWASGGGAVDPAGDKALFMSDSEDHLFDPLEIKPQRDWEKRVDDLISIQEQTFDPVERKKAFDEIQLIYSEQLPLFYLVAPDLYQGVQNKWRNVRVPPSGTLNWNQDEYWLAQTPDDRKPAENKPGLKTE